MTDEATPDGGADVLDRIDAFLGNTVPEAPANPAPKPAAAPAPEASVDATPAAEVEADAGEPVEVEAESPEAPEEADAGPDPAVIAKALGLGDGEYSIGPDGQLLVKTKVKGKEDLVPFNDLRKSYQLESYANARLMEVAEREKAVERAAQERAAAESQKLKQLDDSLALAGQMLTEKWSAVDWATLKATDPIEFNTRYIEYQQDAARLARVQQHLHATRQQKAQEAEAAEQARIAKEYELALTHIPEWKDDGKRKGEQAGIQKMLREVYGFGDEDIAEVAKSSHKAVRILRDAYKYRQLQEKKPAIENKVRAAPKSVSPGVKQETSASDEKAKLLEQFRKGKIEYPDYLLKAGIIK